MIGRDDLLVVRGQVGVRPISTSVFGLKPALNPQLSVTLSRSISNSQPLPVPNFQIRLHKKDDDKAGKQGRVKPSSKVIKIREP
jgi:hypothetical protein